MKDLSIADRQETCRWLNNGAENSHLPFRRRARAMLRVRHMRSLQKFASVHTSVSNHCNQDAVSPADTASMSTAPPLLLNGVVSARHEGQYHCPCGDWFELVCQHRVGSSQASNKTCSCRLDMAGVLTSCMAT